MMSKKRLNNYEISSFIITAIGITLSVAVIIVSKIAPSFKAFWWWDILNLSGFSLLFLGFTSLFYELFQHIIRAENYASKIETLKEEIAKYANINQQLKALLDKESVGIVKKIEQPTIWKLEEDILGWNPNWACELKPTAIRVYDGLRDIHYERIMNSKVKKIEYVILDGYDGPVGEDLRFGKDCFLEFLKDYCSQISDEDNKNSFISNVGKKYKIWIVPENLWNNKEEELFNVIAPFKDFIFIRGTKFSLSNLILFHQSRGFINNGSHDYYIELFGDNEITQALVNLFEKVKSALKNRNIKPLRIVFNNENFEASE